MKSPSTITDLAESACDRAYAMGYRQHALEVAKRLEALACVVPRTATKAWLLREIRALAEKCRKASEA